MNSDYIDARNMLCRAVEAIWDASGDDNEDIRNALSNGDAITEAMGVTISDSESAIPIAKRLHIFGTAFYLAVTDGTDMLMDTDPFSDGGRAIAELCRTVGVLAASDQDDIRSGEVIESAWAAD